MNKTSVLACVMMFYTQAAYAQSFGMDKVEEVNRYAASQGAYVQNYDYAPIPQPTVSMGGGNYMTADGPISNMSNGEYMMPNGVPIGTTVNNVPLSQSPEPVY